MKINRIQNGDSQTFNATLLNSGALVELIGKIPLTECDGFYKLLEEPETIKRFRVIKIDDSEPVAKVFFPDNNVEVLDNWFKMRLSNDGINASVKFKLKETTPEGAVEALLDSIKKASDSLKDSFDYIKKKTAASLDKMNSTAAPKAL